MGRTFTQSDVSYSLEMRGDSVISYLLISEGELIRLLMVAVTGYVSKNQLPIINVLFNKKGTAQIQFRTRSDDDTFAFSVQVFSNGSATINVTPVQQTEHHIL